MEPSWADLHAKLDDLAKRVDTIEARLGIVQVPAARKAPTPPPVPASPPVVPLAPPSSPAPPVAPPLPLRPEPIAPPVVIPRPPATSAPAVVPKPAPPIAPVHAAPSHKKQFPEGLTLERLVGGRIFPVLGAIIVVVGMGLLLKLLVDSGYLVFTPTRRCLGTAAFGLALLGAGEWTRKRYNIWACVGLAGAGIAVVYMAVLAAFSWYQLIGPPAAFVLLVAASGLGIGYSLRANSLALAILAIAGAYLAPPMVGNSDASPMVMPLYLTALLAVGLVLSAWRPRPFRPLRVVAFMGTVLIGSGWIVQSGRHHPYHSLGLLGLVWLAIHAELLTGSRRLPESVATGALPPGQDRGVAKRLAAPIVLSFGATIWSVVTGVLLVQFAQPDTGVPDWMIPAAGAVGTLVLAIVLAGNLRVLQDPPSSDRERLGAALWMQSAALLVCAVAMGVTDWTQVLAWFAMGVAAVAVARWAHLRRVGWYGVILLLLGTGRVLLYESWHLSPAPGGSLYLGLWLSKWTALMIIGGIAWGAAGSIAERRDSSPRRREMVSAAFGFGLMLMFGSVLWPETKAVCAFASISLLIVALAALSRFRSSRVLGITATVWCFAAGSAWLVRRLSLESGVFGHPGLDLTEHLWIGIMICAASTLALLIAGYLRALRGGELSPAERVRAVLWLFAGVFLVCTIGLGLQEWPQVLVWYGLGLTALAIARVAGLGRLGWYGIALMLLGSIRTVAYETWNLSPAPGGSLHMGIWVSKWTLLMVVGGVAWAVIGAVGARASSLKAEREPVSSALGLGLMMVFTSIFWPETRAMWAYSSGGILVVCLVLLARLRGSKALAFATVGWCLTGAIGWLVRRLSVAPDVDLASQEFFSQGLWIGLIVCAATFIAARVIRNAKLGDWSSQGMSWLLTACGVALLFVCTSFEVARVAPMHTADRTAQAAAVSIWWALFAVTLLATGFWKKVAPMRYLGLGLLCVATAKGVIFDMADVAQLWRVVSYLVLGMLLLAVAVAYAKVAGKSAPPAEPSAKP